MAMTWISDIYIASNCFFSPLNSVDLFQAWASACSRVRRTHKKITCTVAWFNYYSSSMLINLLTCRDNTDRSDPLRDSYLVAGVETADSGAPWRRWRCCLCCPLLTLKQHDLYTFPTRGRRMDADWFRVDLKLYRNLGAVTRNVWWQ